MTYPRSLLIAWSPCRTVARLMTVRERVPRYTVASWIIA